jgi:hypothetical protein
MIKYIFILIFLFIANIGISQEINTSNPIKIKNGAQRTNITLDTSGVVTSIHYKNDTAYAVADTVINWKKGNIFKKTLSGNVEFTFSNLTVSVINVIISNTTHTVIWPNTIKWPLGLVPTQSINKIDIYTFIYDGTYVYGSAIQSY